MKGLYMTDKEFKEFCNAEAFRWFIAGYTYEDLTDADILAGYPDGYFSDKGADDRGWTRAFYNQYLIAFYIRLELYTNITWHNGEPYFVVEPVYLDFKDSHGYEHWCGRAVTSHNKPCTVWWFVPEPESYNLDGYACDFAEADAVDFND